MDAQFNNSRFARVCLARCYLRQTAGMLAALALLAGAGAPRALGQKVKVQFIPSPTPSAAQTTAAANPLAPRPMDSNNNGLGPVVGSPGYFFGTAIVNSTATQQQVTVAFQTFSDLASYVPTVSLQYGKSYSAGTVNCTQYANPSYPATSGSYPYLETCTVVITFTPLYPGGHKDAIFVLGTDGKTEVGGEFLYGIGLAPQLMIQPGVTTPLPQLPDGAYDYSYGYTTDDAGTFYLWANDNDFYTSKGGGALALLASNVGRGYSLSIDGAGNLFDMGNSNSGYEYEPPLGGSYPISLCWTTGGNANNNPVIVPYTVCFNNPVVVAAGNLGTYYDADGGGEYYENNSQYSHGLITQAYGTQYPVTSPAPPPENAGIFPPGGDAPLPYPLDSGAYSPGTMLVDQYENLFFLDGNRGMAVWCGWGSGVGLSSSITGSTNGCAGWGTNMVSLNQISNGGNMGTDAADTLYVGQSYNGNIALWMYSAANNYASPLTYIGVNGYAGSTAVAPDGTIYVGAATNNTVDIIDRSQGLIDFGSNNGQTSNPYTMALYNGGNQPLTVSSIAISGTGYTMQPTTTNGCTNGIVIAVGTICQLQVASTPPHPGIVTAAITITSNSLNNPSATQTVSLTGYTSGIYVTASPNPLDIGFVAPGQTSTTPVTLVNTSAGSNSVGYGSTVFINSPLVSSNPAFTASLGTCSSPLASGAAGCQLQVTFNPASAQNYSGTISWTESILGSPGISQQLSVAVTATGINPVITLPPAPETIHITDQLSLVPSTQLPINEAIHITDQLSLVSSTQLPINEAIQVTDQLLLASSTLLPINEAIHVTDQLSLVSSTLLPINETVHITDTPAEVQGYPTSTLLSGNATVVPAGGTLGLTATVKGSGSTSTPTGSVRFLEDGASLGEDNLSSGTATFTTPALAAGSHVFQAMYEGTSQFAGSSSANLTVPATTLNVLTVTAKSFSRSFGVSSPTFGYTVTGYVNGDTGAILSGQPAISTTATPNSLAGVYPIAISVGTLTAPARYALNFLPGTLAVNNDAPQTITFAPIPSIPRVVVQQLTLTAHSSSGLPITYTVTSGSAAVSGSILHLTGTGSVTVSASQNGNSTFAPAVPVSRSFTVTP